LVASASDATTHPTGCVSETGTGGACIGGTALDGATGVTLSPDGSTVYVASETSRAVSVFARDPTTGAISQLAGTDGCVSDSGTGGACADGVALVGPRSVAVSPDGTSFYFPATTSAAVAVFSRDQTTGRLAQLAGTAGCVSETGTGGVCVDGVALDGARSASVSPDGKSVYIASFFSDAAAVFARDSATGVLTQLAGTAGCVTETGTGGVCVDGVALDGARSVAVSSDGKSVYLASETSGAVAVFSRDDSTGAITQLAGTSGCVSQTGTDGACTDVRALGGAGGVALSPDGNNVYVASLSSDAVAVFSRDQVTGVLTQMVGTAGCVSETGNGGSCVDGRALDRPRSVAVSLDGTNVYVAAETGDAVAVFSRDQTTGALTQLPGSAGCVSETGSGGACADGTALDGMRSVAVSPDGKSVYAASFYSGAVAIFSRDEATGALTQLGEAPSNTAPVVSAGPDQTITLHANATLDGTVTDDGQPSPPATLTTAWTQAAGSGTATFQNASAVDTSASFSAAGTYTLRLTANDSALSVFDELMVTVTNVNEFPPVITSNGGGASAAVSAAENQTAVTDVNASDGDGTSPTYSIAGGPDAARFAIVPATGVLTFVTAPNFEAPTDVGGNNVYDVIVQASDGSLSDTQTLALTVTDVAENPGSPLYFSLVDLATVGGVTADNEDVVFFDGTSFSLAFDGADVGLAAFRIDAFSWISATSLLLSFDTPGTIPGIAGTIDDSDLVRFDATSLGTDTAGTFTMYFDGSNVGLTTSGGDVDAVEPLPTGDLLISTINTIAVTGAAGEDEDLLRFAPTSIGPNTAGTFSLYFDGSDVGLTATGEDVDAAAVGADGKIYLSTFNNFSVTGVSGADEDVFVFTPSSLGDTTAGTYSPTLYFDGSAFGLAANDVFAIDLP
jgi:6-phosphogluconolactonase (cycloisomerase 2 family)